LGAIKKKNTLNNKLEYHDNYFEGVFWIQDNDNYKISATLYIDDKGTATISSLQHLNENIRTTTRKFEIFDIVFGYINCHKTSKTFSIKLYETSQILRSSGALTKCKYQSLNAFISPKFDSEINLSEYNSVMLNSRIITEWIPTTGFKPNSDDISQDKFVVNQIYESPKPIDLFQNDNFNIYIFFRAFTGSPSQRESYITEEIYVNIETSNSNTIKKLYKIKSTIERLLSIILFTPINSKKTEFRSTSGDHYRALNINEGYNKGNINLLDFDSFLQSSQDIFTKWFEKQNNLELFIKNFFSVFRQKGVMIENKFLTYISVLENYHAKNINRDNYLKKRLIDLIENSCLNENITNVNKYAEKLKITRNYYAHLEERHEENSLSLDEIIIANQIIEVIIHEILLKEVGINNYTKPSWIKELTDKINQSLG
jgi:hypothetical protein